MEAGEEKEYDKCINALSDYCIFLIKKRAFCKAKAVGQAIEMLLNSPVEATCEVRIGTVSDEREEAPVPSRARRRR
jgi:hypothetical protein